jgi:hypothetical protein
MTRAPARALPKASPPARLAPLQRLWRRRHFARLNLEEDFSQIRESVVP